jgi:protein transport protein SEC31
LRLFQSIVTDDLADIVQNADLRGWQEIFAVLCTFASQDEFSSRAEQLGGRLEFHSTFKSSEAAGSIAKAQEFRKNAMLTYLLAGCLEQLISSWVEEMIEEEKNSMSNQEHLNLSRYTAHALALQTSSKK